MTQLTLPVWTRATTGRCRWLMLTKSCPSLKTVTGHHTPNRLWLVFVPRLHSPWDHGSFGAAVSWGSVLTNQGLSWDSSLNLDPWCLPSIPVPIKGSLQLKPRAVPPSVESQLWPGSIPPLGLMAEQQHHAVAQVEKKGLSWKTKRPFLRHLGS